MEAWTDQKPSCNSRLASVRHTAPSFPKVINVLVQLATAPCGWGVEDTFLHHTLPANSRRDQKWLEEMKWQEKDRTTQHLGSFFKHVINSHWRFYSVFYIILLFPPTIREFCRGGLGLQRGVVIPLTRIVRYLLPLLLPITTAPHCSRYSGSAEL